MELAAPTMSECQGTAEAARRNPAFAGVEMPVVLVVEVPVSGMERQAAQALEERKWGRAGSSAVAGRSPVASPVG